MKIDKGAMTSAALAGSLFVISPSFTAWAQAASELERLIAELSCASRIPLDELEPGFREWMKSQNCTIKEGIEHCKQLAVLGHPVPWQSFGFDGWQYTRATGVVRE